MSEPSVNPPLQSSEAYEFIKRDLTEFSNVVQHDTACSIVATANAVKSKLAVCFLIARTSIYVYISPKKHPSIIMLSRLCSRSAPGGRFVRDHGEGEEEPF